MAQHTIEGRPTGELFLISLCYSALNISQHAFINTFLILSFFECQSSLPNFTVTLLIVSSLIQIYEDNTMENMWIIYSTAIIPYLSNSNNHNGEEKQLSQLSSIILRYTTKLMKVFSALVIITYLKNEASIVGVISEVLKHTVSDNKN